MLGIVVPFTGEREVSLDGLVALDECTLLSCGERAQGKLVHIPVYQSKIFRLCHGGIFIFKNVLFFFLPKRVDNSDETFWHPSVTFR